MASEQLWCRVLWMDDDGSGLATWTLTGPGRPDLLALDGVARLCLAALQAGARASVRDSSPDMASLLGLLGSAVDVERKPEYREDALDVQEAMELPDTPV